MPTTRVKWSDLAAMLAGGAVILEVKQLPFADTEIIMQLSEAEMTNEKTRLTMILESMLSQAREVPGIVARRDVAHGLHLDITQSADKSIRLQLSRPGVCPSLLELRTIIKYWPTAISQRTLETAKTVASYKGRGYLMADIIDALPEELEPEGAQR